MFTSWRLPLFLILVVVLLLVDVASASENFCQSLQQGTETIRALGPWSSDNGQAPKQLLLITTGGNVLVESFDRLRDDALQLTISESPPVKKLAEFFPNTECAKLNFSVSSKFNYFTIATGTSTYLGSIDRKSKSLSLHNLNKLTAAQNIKHKWYHLGPNVLANVHMVLSGINVAYGYDRTCNSGASACLDGLITANKKGQPVKMAMPSTKDATGKGSTKSAASASKSVQSCTKACIELTMTIPLVAATYVDSLKKGIVISRDGTVRVFSIDFNSETSSEVRSTTIAEFIVCEVKFAEKHKDILLVGFFLLVIASIGGYTWWKDRQEAGNQKAKKDGRRKAKNESRESSDESSELSEEAEEEPQIKPKQRRSRYLDVQKPSSIADFEAKPSPPKKVDKKKILKQIGRMRKALAGHVKKNIKGLGKVALKRGAQPKQPPPGSKIISSAVFTKRTTSKCDTSPKVIARPVVKTGPVKEDLLNLPGLIDFDEKMPSTVYDQKSTVPNSVAISNLGKSSTMPLKVKQAAQSTLQSKTSATNT